MLGAKRQSGNAVRAARRSPVRLRDDDPGPLTSVGVIHDRGDFAAVIAKVVSPDHGSEARPRGACRGEEHTFGHWHVAGRVGEAGVTHLPPGASLPAASHPHESTERHAIACPTVLL